MDKLLDDITEGFGSPSEVRNILGITHQLYYKWKMGREIPAKRLIQIYKHLHGDLTVTMPNGKEVKLA